MKIGYIKNGIFLLSLLLIALPSFSYADTVSLFGPETFTSTKDKPDRFERSFQLPSGAGAPFILKVTNGTSDGKNRIRSAMVYINGVKVIKEMDLNHHVYVIERGVSLLTKNTLVVELRCKPGGFITVEITGISIMPSVKKVIGPAGGIVELQGSLNSVKFDIPSGALDVDTEITIRQVPTPSPDLFMQRGGVPIGNTFSFEPHGLTFSKVATITFTYRDEYLPPGVDIMLGDLAVYIDGPDGLLGLDGGAQCHPLEKRGEHCVSTESFAQDIDIDNNLVTVFVNKLSRRLLYYAGIISGCNGDPNIRPTRITLEADGFSLPILRCLRPNVTARPESANITRIVLHSTSNGNARVAFRGEVNCAINPNRCQYFAHYYISRDGTIVRVTEDTDRAIHTPSNNTLGVTNDNSIGIELFNNVGEPYDGRQITTLIQLMDTLIRLHPTISRPTFPRDTASTSVFSHYEVDLRIPRERFDPVGTFRTSNEIWYFNRTEDPDDWISMPLPGGSDQASTLFDAVVSGVSAMGGNFTGLINTSGGDSLGLANAGAGGNIYYTGEGITPIPVETNYTDNNPLIVPQGETIELSGDNYTDMIINGTLKLTVDAGINIAGTIFITSAGNIITSDDMDGNSLTLNSNGSPIINGVIDLRGKYGGTMPSGGGNGGAISLYTALEGPLFIPTLVTRGGDTDQSDCPNSQVYPPVLCTSFIAGNGGAIVITSADGDIIFSGTTTGNSTYIPDTLPPPPPYNLGTPDKSRPDSGERLPLEATNFRRGLLTSGGIGGSGTGWGPWC